MGRELATVLGAPLCYIQPLYSHISISEQKRAQLEKMGQVPSQRGKRPEAWELEPTLPPTGSVTSGQLLGLSEPWIPVYKKVKSLSSVRLFATPWTAAHQAPPSMGFSRQEYWSGVPFLVL